MKAPAIIIVSLVLTSAVLADEPAIPNQDWLIVVRHDMVGGTTTTSCLSFPRGAWSCLGLDQKDRKITDPECGEFLRLVGESLTDRPHPPRAH